MLYRTYTFNNFNPTEIVKTKKAWRRYFKKHRKECIYVVPSSAPQFWGDEIPMKPVDFLNMLIKNGELELVDKKRSVK